MRLPILTLLGVVTISARAQVASADTFSAALPGNTNFSSSIPGWFLIERGPHHRIWQSSALVTNRDGAVTAQKSRYVELATGMAHQVNDEWIPSTDQFVVTANGAEATNSQHQVTLLGNLNSSGAVTLTTPEGKRLVSNLLGLSYFDTATGNSVWIGETKDSYGELLSSGNEAVFRDALSGCQADVLYLNGISRFEQILLIREQLPPCTDYSMNPASTLLCVITEFLNPPEPVVVPQTINGVTDPRLDFGIMQIVHGDAFAIGSETNRIPTVKHWVTLDGRQCLVEAVPLRAVQALLDALPPASVSSAAPDPFLHKLFAGNLNTRGSIASFATLHPPQKRASAPTPPFKLARALPSGKGLAMDYTVVTTQTDPFTFRGDTVYYVTNTVTLGATNNVIEGLAVIKLAKTPSASIVANGLIWKTGPYAPAVFTAKDDNTVGCGDLIPGSTGNPNGFYGGVALDLSSAPNSAIANARFSYLSNTLAGTGLTLRNVQFMQCLNGIYTEDPNPSLYNVLIYKMGNFEPVAATGGENLVFENVTAHFCTNLLGDPTSIIRFTNCLFVCVTNWQTLQPSWVLTNACAFLNSDSGIFQSVGAGSHYLADNSPYRGAGTTNIEPELLSDLRKKTTFPPIVCSGTTFSTDTTFAPQAQRDTDPQPALGVHYDPLDYVFGNCTANANLLFQEGTAAAWFRNNGGIRLANLKTATFNGTATAPCWWVRYNTVQEQATSTWSGGSGWGGILGAGATLSVAPTVNANFLHCSILGGEGGYGNHFRDNNAYLIVRSWSSEYAGGSVGGYASAQYHTNCLFDRVSLWLEAGQTDNTWRLRNCTLHGGQLYINRSANPTPVSVRDCTFDSAAFPVTDRYANNANYTDYDYNAFLSGQPRTVTNGIHDKIVTGSFGWQTSWFGNYYLPADSALLAGGDVTADTLGLYHFTTLTNQTIEATNTVTIGYHYVATDANGLPLDANADGIPNYISDSNGNGLVDSGEIGWNVGGDLGLKVLITRPKNNSIIP